MFGLYLQNTSPAVVFWTYARQTLHYFVLPFGLFEYHFLCHKNLWYSVFRLYSEKSLWRLYENMQDKYGANLILNVTRCCFSPGSAFTWKFVTEDWTTSISIISTIRDFLWLWISHSKYGFNNDAADAMGYLWRRTMRLFSDHRLSKIIFGWSRFKYKNYLELQWQVVITNYRSHGLEAIKSFPMLEWAANGFHAPNIRYGCDSISF